MKRFSRVRALAQADGGQSIVELAIITPLLLALLIGIVEVGQYAYEGIEVGNAARAGVQYGAQSLTTAADTTPTGGMANAAKFDAKEIPNVAASPSNSCSCYSTPGTTFACTTPIATQPCNSPAENHRLVYVTVVASGTFTPFVAYPGFPASLLISRTATQQVSP